MQHLQPNTTCRVEKNRRVLSESEKKERVLGQGGFGNKNKMNYYADKIRV